jgi:hypothetical protein
MITFEEREELEGCIAFAKSAIQATFAFESAGEIELARDGVGPGDLLEEALGKLTKAEERIGVLR